MSPQPTITPQSTMQELFDAYPSARQILQRHHVDGQKVTPTDTLEQVLKVQGIENAQEVLDQIRRQEETQAAMQVTPRELAEDLKAGNIKLLDVRGEQEHALIHIDGDVLATEELAQKILETWPKETAIVLYCHQGKVSPEAVSYLTERGFPNVKMLRGGIDAWSREIDPLLPRYE